MRRPATVELMLLTTITLWALNLTVRKFNFATTRRQAGECLGGRLRRHLRRAVASAFFVPIMQRGEAEIEDLVPKLEGAT